MDYKEREVAQAQLIPELKILRRRLAELEKPAAVHQARPNQSLRVNRFLEVSRPGNEAWCYGPSEADPASGIIALRTQGERRQAETAEAGQTGFLARIRL
jgi:hypothetical protein